MNSLPRFHWTGKSGGAIIKALFAVSLIFLENTMNAVCADSLAAPRIDLRAQTAALPRPAVTARQGICLSSCWTLDAGQALTLQSPQAGVLQVARGRLWVTFNHAAQDPSERGGDHFLGGGESLHLSRGDTVVMEAYDPNRAVATCFSWVPG